MWNFLKRLFRISSPERHKMLKPCSFKKLYRLRLWRLGSLEHKLFPTDEAMQRLADILKNWDGQHDLDIIWGPAIDCKEYFVSEDEIDAIYTRTDIKIIKPDEAGKITLKSES